MKENVIQRFWRSAMAWQYLIICVWDFMIAPIATTAFAYWANTPVVAWVPLTLQGGAIYHLSMGAIVGVTSWSRTKEKINAALQAEKSTS